MGLPQCNTTAEFSKIQEIPAFHGKTFHHAGFRLAALNVLIATLLANYLIFMHAIRYSRPVEQRNIIRIIFMIPVYAWISLLAYVFYTKHVYLEVVRAAYEGIAIASFFALVCQWVASDLHEQKDYFRTITLKPWIFPIRMFQPCTGGKKGLLRVPRSGLTWFNVIWVGVYQYVFVRIIFTIVAIIAEATGRYCETSNSPAFAHVWVQGFEGLSVGIAMTFLIQLYVQLRADIGTHKPVLKFLAIKLVIFLSLWQTQIFSFLISNNILKPSPKIAEPDLRVGIPNLLLTVEMTLFAIFYLWAFPWRAYRIKAAADKLELEDPKAPTLSYQGGFLGCKAIIDAMNPMDLIRASARTVRWVFVGRRNRNADSEPMPLSDVKEAFSERVEEQ